MKGALRIATFAGIPLLVHWSFSLILLWILYLGFSFGLGLLGMGWLLLLMLALFSCVILHEYGHALTARRYNVTTKDIILFPIGGVARLTSLPEEPWEEFKIAIAGPLVNVVLAVFIGLIIWLVSKDGFSMEVQSEEDAKSLMKFFLPGLFWMNVVLVVFNLLPAFPMDGGRMLRSLLALRMSRLKATRIASILGQIMAVLFVVFGLFAGKYVLCFIGVFVFITARQEYRAVKMDTLLSNSLVSEIMRTQFTRFQLADPMEAVINTYKQGGESNFLIFDQWNRIAGVLHEAFILEAIKNKEKEPSVNAQEYLSPRFERVSGTDSLKSIFQKIQQSGYSILPVFDEDDLVGVIDIKGLNHFMKGQPKLTKSRK